jgi:ribonuclease HI
MAKQKFYVVWKGNKTGTFNNWSEVQASVNGFKGAKFKSYPSESEANSAYSEGHEKALSGNDSSSSASKSKSSMKKESLPKTNINIYCDGSSIPNPGKTGSGICIYKNDVLIKAYHGGYHEMESNNYAELLALNFALKIVEKSTKAEPVSIHIDSQYTIDCITKWASGWKKKGWKRSNNGEVKNLELIKVIYALYQTLQDDVLIKKVKAHNGIEGNEIADRLANYGRMTEQKDFISYKSLDIQHILAISD